MATTKHKFEDRVSNFSDKTVPRFLSHLPKSTLARLSTVSKRCREFCKSNPALFFTTSHTRDEEPSPRGFCNFLYRPVALHFLYKELRERFCLEWIFLPTLGDKKDQVRKWLKHELNPRVEDICLKDFYPREPFSLPPSVLGCKSLRFLKINARYQPFLLPSSLSVPSFAKRLQVFVLKAVEIDNQSFGEWFSSFKSLRVLKLDGIKGIRTLTIANSSVETLIIASPGRDLRKIDIQKLQKLRNLFINWNACNSSCSKSIKISAPNLQSLSIIWETPFRTSLKISAPNLQRFQWFGSAVDDYCMENSPNLSYASVALLPSRAARANYAATKHSLENVLHSIHRAKSITLWNDFVQVLYVHDCLPFLFGNAEQLAIRGTSIIAPVKPLFSLLEGTTHLKHLILITDRRPSEKLSFNMKYWQSQNLPFTHLLKTVTVELFDGKNEVKQINHILMDADEALEDAEEILKAEELLEDAEELEIMAILSTSPVSQDLITEFKEFMIPSYGIDSLL